MRSGVGRVGSGDAIEHGPEDLALANERGEARLLIAVRAGVGGHVVDGLVRVGAGARDAAPEVVERGGVDPGVVLLHAAMRRDMMSGAKNSAAAAQAAARPHPNIYRHKVGNREAAIQIGSIHSVKGETHTGTLVLETFYYDYNLDSIKEWLLGTKIGAKAGASGKRVNSRLKLHYVAVTRPSHLVCLAMAQSAFETANALDHAKVAQLEAKGWKVRVV